MENFWKKAGKGIKAFGIASWKKIKKAILGFGDFIKKLWMRPKGRVGLILLALLFICAVFAPVIAPFDPYDVTQRAAKGLSPSWEHPLGTTITTGQDIFSMLIYGSRVSLSIGLITGILTAFIGAFMGILAGYIGSWVDTVIMRVVDVMLVIPTLPLTIVLTNLFGKSYGMIIFIFTLFGWTGLSRVVRSQTLVLKNSNYVKAAELAGASRMHIMMRHILPGVSHLLIMSTALTSAGIMVAEAGLSFLGLGDPTAISWGKMLAEVQSGGAMLFGHWWWIIAPGIGIFLAVFAFMRIGVAMEEVFNPRMKQTSSVYKIFKNLNGAYIEEVFDSMDEKEKLGYIEEKERVRHE
ncbi:MAG: ABC transporter permease [Clostridia bacterium]|nr:ABC transporter permease [Clostridia bacterium]